MSEEITNTQPVNTNPVDNNVNVDPQPAAMPVEENTNPVSATQNTTENGMVDNPVDNPTVEQEPTDATILPNVEEDVNSLKQQLEEYRLRDEEVRQLSERLGTNKVPDVQIFEAQRNLDILDNQAQQAYITLCNQFGVDYRPDKIEASANELKAKDPQKFYELQNRIEKLDSLVTQKRNEANQFIRQRELNLALAKHQQILNASPMLQQQLNSYLRNANIDNPMQQIDMFVDMAQAIQREAFEYGKIFTQQENLKQQQNPNNVLNNTVMATNQSYSGQAPKIFTRAEIANMSQSEFEKYEKEIDQAVREGRIR
jgi:hypothetical protein|nr:MAG TPA: hypothetical protein [Bacteriophage sp.]